MLSLKIVSLASKAQFFHSSCASKLLLKNALNSMSVKGQVCRSYSNSDRLNIFKTKTRSISCYMSKSPSNHCLKILLNPKYSLKTAQHSRYIHLSEKRHFHPIVWIALRPILKLLAIISGRAFRKWWKNLPPNKRQYFMEVIKENRKNIAFVALSSATLFLLYYISHIEETPITKRKRFMAFSPKQLEKINQFEFQQIMANMQSQILPTNHPYTFRVKSVVNRILAANEDIKEVHEKKWGVAVIDSSIENAFVLPIGYVFVFTGMLSLCSNDDELGTILAHEMAHCIQNHGAENVSLGHLLDLISIVIIAAIWAIIPSDTLSILTHWLFQKCLSIFFELPYNRKIETEADVVGLQLAAKACFDVRESSAFWAKMAIFHRTVGKVPEIEFLSTHPNHETRSEYLDSIMNEALDLRHKCGCPKLKRVDPRLDIQVTTKALEAARKAYLQKYPKPEIVRI